MEYQQIAAAGSSPAPSTDRSLEVVVLERCGGGSGGLVFGTLLGPETTGPGCTVLWGVRCPGLVFLVSWLHRAHVSALWGVCVGCVVRGCCLRTT